MLYSRCSRFHEQYPAEALEEHATVEPLATMDLRQKLRRLRKPARTWTTSAMAAATKHLSWDEHQAELLLQAASVAGRLTAIAVVPPAAKEASAFPTTAAVAKEAAAAMREVLGLHDGPAAMRWATNAGSQGQCSEQVGPDEAP